jgi:hypothetical protein
LSDDDHAIYSLVDGTRAFTGTVGGVTPVADSDLATKGYADSISGVFAENTDVDSAAAEVVDSFADTDGNSVVWSYLVKSNAGTNLRAGTVIAVWDPTGNTVEYTDTSTDDIGDTSGVDLSVDITSDNVRLMCSTTSDNWSVYVQRKSILG